MHGKLAVNAQEATKWFRESDTFFREGRYHEALYVLEELDKSYPNSKNVLFPKALCMDRLGRAGEAVAICDQLIMQFNDPRAQTLKDQLLTAPQRPERPIPASLITPSESSAPTQKMKRAESPAAGTGVLRRSISIVLLAVLLIALAGVIAGKLLGWF